MCGIAGILYSEPGRSVERAVLQSMGSAIAHRGPDAEGSWNGPGVGLVHRRLSIIDLAGGDQPIGNEDRSVQVVFNGEIYNYQSLRRELTDRGHRFRTNSDTEVLVHLYEEEGERLVERLRGMFAFALWDRRERRLLLARDRLGIKPLYVYRDAEKLLFGSEIKAVLAHPGVDRKVSPEALEDYLAYGAVPGPRSIFQRIEKLPPAHTLMVQASRLDAAPRRYWRLRFEPDLRPSLDEWAEAVRAKLAETVRAHLASDVPVGAFLSGGLDSGIVAALASEEGRGGLRTFSIGFDDQRFSELPHARRVAEKYQTRHVEEVVTADAASLVDELTLYYDEPFADGSAVPTYLVSRLAAGEVKVVLSGDGGDEAFGGYRRYAHDLKEAAVRRRLPAWFRRKALGPLGKVYPKADWLPRPLRAKTALTNLSLDDAGAYANSLALCRPPLLRRLLAPEIARNLNGHDPGLTARQGFASAPAGDPLAGMVAADLATLLPDDYLVKIDRASMAHGLEVRPPMLDHELMELAARIPSNLKIHEGQTKRVLKQAGGDLLPSGALGLPKRGFEVPLDAWLRGPLRPMFEAMVLDPDASGLGLINRDTARRLYQAHLRGTGRHGAVLWGLLVLARWADRYLGPSPALPAGF